MPVGAVLGAAGQHPAQVHLLPGHRRERAQVGTRHEIGQTIAALVVDRHQVRAELADLAASHPAGHGQGAGGEVEVLRGLPGHQLDMDLVPGAAGTHLHDAGQLLAARARLGTHGGAPEWVHLHCDARVAVGNGPPTRPQPAGHPRRVDDPALPPRAQMPTRPRLERGPVRATPRQQADRDQRDRGQQRDQPEPVPPGQDCRDRQVGAPVPDGPATGPPQTLDGQPGGQEHHRDRGPALQQLHQRVPGLVQHPEPAYNAGEDHDHLGRGHFATPTEPTPTAAHRWWAVCRGTSTRPTISAEE